MFRRRPIRGPIGGPARNANRPAAAARQALIEANRLMDQGKFEQAAPIFERVAQAAQQHGMLARVPNLNLQAARCRYHSGKPEIGRSHLKQALDQLAAMKKWQRLQNVVADTSAELRQLGYPKDAADTEAWLASVLPTGVTQPPSARGSTFIQPAQAARLPVRCPTCGAGLRPNEVEWLDNITAECPYCGGPVQTES